MKVIDFIKSFIFNDLRQNSRNERFKTLIFIKNSYFYKVISNKVIISKNL